MSRLVPLLDVPDTADGTANTSRPWSSAIPAVIIAPPPGGVSMTSVASDIPLTIRLRRGKFAASGFEPKGSSESTAPHKAILSASPLFSDG